MPKNKKATPRFTLMNFSEARGDKSPATHKGPWSRGPRYVTKRARWMVRKEDVPKFKKLYRCNYSFWRMCLLPEDCTPFLMVESGIKSRGRYRVTETSVEDPSFIDQTKTVKILINYPLSCMIEIQVPPSMHPTSKKPIERGIGYYLWVAAKTYRDIYKHDWKRVGVWGHGFDDLWLEGIEILEDNCFELMIGS